MKNKFMAATAGVLALALPWQAFARRGAPEAPASKGALAVVAIPAYVDTTGSQNYGYLSGSLTDAVNSSMQQKFDYARASQSAVDGETKKAWKPNKMPSDMEIRQIATATGSDYVVVGSYTLSADKKQIVFNTRIFIAPDKFINAPAFTNNADATLFDATNKVATEIVKSIEDEARARATAANQTQVKEGEKIALSKVQSPEESKKSEESSSSARNSDRYLGVGIGYATNTVERQTQFYQYASSALNLNVDLRITPNLLLYGKVAFPQTPSGDLIPTTYQNKGNQTIGLETGNRRGSYVFGLNYRNFSDTNPAGIYQRDLLKWSSSLYLRSHFSLFDVGGVFFGIDLDSYLDFLSVKKTAAGTTDSSEIGLLLNLESSLTVGYFIPVINTSLTGLFGGAYSFIDSTNRPMNVTSSQDVQRSMIFVGLRYGLELEKWFGGVQFKLEGFITPSLADKFQPLDNRNLPQKSMAYAVLSAGYRLGF